MTVVPDGHRDAPLLVDRGDSHTSGEGSGEPGTPPRSTLFTTGMYDLQHFTLSDMTRCGIELRRLGAGASSMEEVAGRVVRWLHEHLSLPDDGGRACALVRMFVTMPYASLEAEQQDFARALLGGAPGNPAMKCLTLLASAGELEPWNSRHASAGHKALPLMSGQGIERSPMIAQLIRQLGVELETLLSPDFDVMVDAAQRSFNVFHIHEAEGSPYIPAQAEFVVPHRIRSVIGFGGVLPPGEMFATILFARTPIPREIADLFKTVALNVKVALLPFAGSRTFA